MGCAEFVVLLWDTEKSAVVIFLPFFPPRRQNTRQCFGGIYKNKIKMLWLCNSKVITIVILHSWQDLDVSLCRDFRLLQLTFCDDYCEMWLWPTVAFPFKKRGVPSSAFSIAVIIHTYYNNRFPNTLKPLIERQQSGWVCPYTASYSPAWFIQVFLVRGLRKNIWTLTQTIRTSLHRHQDQQRCRWHFKESRWFGID